MLITNKNISQEYSTDKRLWQGIPSIEVTKGGRIFLTYYSGGTKEEVGNYCILSKSDDGESFEDIAITYKESFRCYDPCLWIDPLDRLWFTWAMDPDRAVWATVCDNPDAKELVWSEPKSIGREVMMNKPTVLTTGEWIFPIAVWNVSGPIVQQSDEKEKLAFAYKSVDNGKSFERLGGCDMPKRSFDEHMILELEDGRLAMYVRTTYGIGVSYSYDRGKTWTKGEDSGLRGPCSRFFIRRLRSGRVLLINHYNNVGRSHLTAMLSEDDGKTWPYKLLLDERANVSYPDATEAEDGYIHITYDRERGAFLNSLEKVYASAREILVAKITENDIINGNLISESGYLKRVAAKLGKYALENSNPYREISKLSDEELADMLSSKDTDTITSFLFEHYGINCINLHKLETNQLDALFDSLKENKMPKNEVILGLIKLLRGVKATDSAKTAPIIDRAKILIEQSIAEDLTVTEIADKLNISVYYLCHVFKSETGITPIDYRNSVKLTMAKRLLIHTDSKIGDISLECGFGSASYFSKIFVKSEGISPAEYRAKLKSK